MFMECGNPICSQPGRYACKVCADAAYCSLGCRSLCWEYHQECCKPRLLPNYVVRFHLGADDIADPPIVRTLSCPATATFYDLHVALQCAFGWAFTHFFDFTVLNPAFRPPADKVRLYRDKLKAHSAGVQVDSSLPQEFLLRIVNFAKWVPFSAFDSAHEPYRRHPNTREEDADDFMLFMLFDDPAYQGLPMAYTYDFGDEWVHRMEVVGRSEPTAEFACLQGEGHGAAEDAGGAAGWAAVREAYRADRPTAAQAALRAWYETECRNGDPAGLAAGRDRAWDPDAVRAGLASENLRARARGKVLESLAQFAGYARLTPRAAPPGQTNEGSEGAKASSGGG